MTGQIQFDTHPETIFLFIDGSFVGATPVDELKAEAGPHEFRLSTSSLEDYTGGFMVYENKKTHIIIDTDTADKIKRYEEYIDIPPEQEPSSPTPPTEIGELTRVTAEGFDAVKSGLLDIKKDTDALVNDNAVKEGYGDVGAVPFTSNLIAITTASPNVDSNGNTIIYPETQIACTDAANPNSLTITGRTGYDIISVHQRIGRNAPFLSVFVKGTVPVFFRSSSDGKNFSPEIQVDVGRSFRFKDVFELRARSTIVGTISKVVGVIPIGNINTVITYPSGGVYQVTEHLTEIATVNVNKTGLTPIVKAIPAPPAFITIGVPNNSVNTTIGLRAHVLNTAFVFVSGTQAGLTGATAPPTGDGNYHTLAKGDPQRWNLTQGAQIFIGASAAGQFIEFGQEADV